MAFAYAFADFPITNRGSETALIKDGYHNIYVSNLSLEMTEDELRKEVK